MSETSGRRAASWAILAALAGAGSPSSVWARSLEDAVKLAVIKHEVAPNFNDDRDVGKQASAYWDYYTGKGFTFGDFRLMSLTGDEVCGWFQKANGPKVDFYYYGYGNGNNNLFTQITHPQIIQSNCLQPRRSMLAGKSKTWILNCLDQSPTEPARRCLLLTPLPNEDKGSLAMAFVNGDRGRPFASMFFNDDEARGRHVIMTVAGESTTCALVPVPGEQNVFVPCDAATSGRLAMKFLDSTSIKVDYGDHVFELASEEPHQLSNEAMRYLRTFPSTSP